MASATVASAATMEPASASANRSTTVEAVTTACHSATADYVRAVETITTVYCYAATIPSSRGHIRDDHSRNPGAHKSRGHRIHGTRDQRR